MSLKSPLLKKIQTLNGFYLYDAKSNRLFRVSNLMFDIVDSIGILSDEKILQQFSFKYDDDIIQKEIDRLKSLINNFNFLSVGPLIQRVGPVKPEDVDQLLLHGPQALTLEVTESCNLRCRYCIFSGGYPSMRSHGYANMDWTTAKSAIDFYMNFIKNDDMVSVGFYGGEPLLQYNLIKQCIEYIRHHKSINNQIQKYHFSLTTNATLLTMEMIDYFIKNQFCLTISLDGPKHFHDQNRVDHKGEGTYDKVFNVLNKIYKRDKKYYDNFILINSVIAPKTKLIELKKYFDNYPHLFGNKLNFSSVDDGNDKYMKNNPQYGEYQRDFWNLYDDFLNMHLSGNNKISNSAKKSFVDSLLEYDFLTFYKRTILDSGVEKLNRINTCIPGKRKLFVDINGNFHACERVTRQFAIGDVKKGYDIDRITLYMNRFCEVMNSEECRNCWAVQMCPICYTVGKNGAFSKEEILKKCTNYKLKLENTLHIYCLIIEESPNAFDYFENYILS